MKGIYLTEKGKQEVENKIAELEKERFYGSELNSDYRIGQQKVWKEILSSATILPVEESWDNLPLSFWYKDNSERLYPNGVIIQPKQ
jgi:hypothetical protein